MTTVVRTNEGLRPSTACVEIGLQALPHGRATPHAVGRLGFVEFAFAISYCWRMERCVQP
jgi:hypothetical protein